MGLLSDETWVQMRQWMTSVKDDNLTAIAIRRNGTTLDGQNVRLVRRNPAKIVDTGGIQGSVGTTLVIGSYDLNIQPGDRFTAGGLLFQVVAVRPNRRTGTIAEASTIQ